MTKLSTVRVERAEFTWAPYGPDASLTLICGVPGQGKSTLTVELAARASRGQLDGNLRGTPVDVIVASAEDAVTFTLAPRFTAAGADLERIHIVTVKRDGLDMGLSLPDDLEQLREAIQRTGARMLVIDPLLAHIPTRVDGYKDQHVRIALAPLSRMAEDLRVAVFAVMHLNKREAGDLFSRVGGSGAFLAAARSALLVGQDPDDEGARVLVHGKVNLSAPGPSLRLRIEGREVADPNGGAPIATSGVAWLGESDHTAYDLLHAVRAMAPRDDAKAFLVKTLSNGPMPAEWVLGKAKDQGISERTLRRAASELGVLHDRIGFGAEGRYDWTLPAATEGT